MIRMVYDKKEEEKRKKDTVSSRMRRTGTTLKNKIKIKKNENIDSLYYHCPSTFHLQLLKINYSLA